MVLRATTGADLRKVVMFTKYQPQFVDKNRIL